MRAASIGLALICCLVQGSMAWAQYSLTATPYQTGGYSFYENYNLGWGLQGRGFFFNWNGGNAVPPFGNFDPNAQAQLGGAFRAGPLSGGFRLTAGQGADTSMVSQSPSVTVMNGGVGYFSDTTQRPFVTSITPVIGGGYTLPNLSPAGYYRTPLQERLARLQAENNSTEHRSTDQDENRQQNRPVAAVAPITTTTMTSSAEQGAASLAQIRAQQANESEAKQREVDELLARADALAAEGKSAVARIFYQQAARRTAGEQQTAILNRIRELK